MTHLPQRRRYGLTVIELMVVVALIGVLIALAAPSMRSLISAQRVKSINAELVTDLQFARSEATRRNRPVLVRFKPENNCYAIFIPATGAADCDCNGSPGVSVCEVDQEEIKTVKIATSSSVAIGASGATGQQVIAFEESSGSIGTDEYFVVTVTGTPNGQLRTRINRAGRPTVCSPDGSISGTPPC